MRFIFKFLILFFIPLILYGWAGSGEDPPEVRKKIEEQWHNKEKCPVYPELIEREHQKVKQNPTREGYSFLFTIYLDYIGVCNCTWEEYEKAEKLVEEAIEWDGWYAWYDNGVWLWGPESCLGMRHPELKDKIIDRFLWWKKKLVDAIYREAEKDPETWNRVENLETGERGGKWYEKLDYGQLLAEYRKDYEGYAKVLEEIVKEMEEEVMDKIRTRKDFYDFYTAQILAVGGLLTSSWYKNSQGGKDYLKAYKYFWKLIGVERELNKEWSFEEFKKAADGLYYKDMVKARVGAYQEAMEKGLKWEELFPEDEKYFGPVPDEWKEKWRKKEPEQVISISQPATKPSPITETSPQIVTSAPLREKEAFQKKETFPSIEAIYKSPSKIIFLCVGILVVLIIIFVVWRRK